MLTSIEFVWKTEIVGNPAPSLETTKYDGYTEMTFVDSDPPETAHGSGFYIGFRPNAKKFNFWFARLTDLSIKILLRPLATDDGELLQSSKSTEHGTKSNRKSLVPRTEEERENFVRQLDASLKPGDKPHFGRGIRLPWV